MTMYDRVFAAPMRALHPLLWTGCIVAALVGCKSKENPAPAPATDVGDEAPTPPTSAPPAEAGVQSDGDHDDDAHPPGCHQHAEALPGTELPGTSIFHLTNTFTTTTGEEIQLASLRGKPSVFVMFYGSCTTACPMLFSDALQIEQQLPEDIRRQVRFVFVTFDPVRDTREVLAARAENLELDMTRWALLRGNDSATRALSTVLGVQYRADGQGEFNHTNRISIVDPEGTVVYTLDGLRQPNDEAVRVLTELVTAQAH